MAEIKIVLTFVVEEDEVAMTRRNLMRNLGAKDHNGAGRLSPWLPGFVFSNVERAEVDGEIAFDRREESDGGQ